MKLVEKRNAKKRIVVNEIGLFIQAVLIACVIALLIMSAFEPLFSTVLEFVLAIALFTMAYNNTKTFKRQLFTIPYIIGGLMCLYFGIDALIKVF